MPTLNDEQRSALDSMVAYATAHREKKCAPAYKDEDGFSMGADSSPLSHTKPFIFTGLAGTGKTTVIGMMINDLLENHGYVPGRIGVCAFTGKATSVLNKKLGATCPVVAKTIHRLIYHVPSDRADMLSNKIDMIEAEIDKRRGGAEVGHPDLASFSLDALRDERKRFMDELRTVLGGSGRLTFTRQSPAEVHTNYDLIIVDEASMVNKDMADHLLDTGLPIIFVGDGNQLPPVREDFGVNLRKPDAKLTTIMRQQGDSDIITVAHDILKRQKLPPAVEGLVGVKRSKSSNPLAFFPTRSIEDAPQFVVHYNADRHRINKVIRQHVLGVTGDDYMPLKGEKIMLDTNLPEKRLMKGDILVIREMITDMPEIPSGRADANLSRWRAAVDQITTVDYTAEFLVEDSYGNEHEMKFFLNDLMMSMGHSAGLDTRDEKQYREIRYKRQGGLDVMFPYAITCYKAQGSEWPRVVVQNYGSNLNGLYLPYIYTAVTRARDELTIVG